MGDLSQYFSSHEFACPCGKCSGGTMNAGFLEKLIKLRELFGKPIYIESGYRDNYDRIFDRPNNFGKLERQ